MPIVTTRQLTRRYGQRVGVEGVDLEIGDGEIFGFLGPNGAGKTTTIRLLLGFMAPTAGGASIFGMDCWRDSYRIKRDVGYLPGDLRLYPWMTGARALRMVGRIRGVDLAEPGRRIAERLRLEMTVPVRKMSRGMRQKLGLVLALAPAPRLLVLDEPTSGLDPLMQDELAELIRERAARGTTVFFSSHTLKEVEDLCDRVAIVRRGRLVADETLETLRRSARREFVVVFRDEAAAATTSPPPFMEITRRTGRRWHGLLDGAAGELIPWLGAHAVDDVTISPPDLDSLFRAYYERHGEAER
jgi:ABC-2 type transport system ATP-binding protein